MKINIHAYVIDVAEALEDFKHREAADKEFMEEAERQGGIYTLEEFQERLNNEESFQSWVRFIEAPAGKINLRVAYGEDLVRKIYDNEETMNLFTSGTLNEIEEGEIKEYQFDTQEEADAFIKGLDEGDGWNNYATHKF